MLFINLFIHTAIDTVHKDLFLYSTHAFHFWNLSSSDIVFHAFFIPSNQLVQILYIVLLLSLSDLYTFLVIRF